MCIGIVNGHMIILSPLKMIISTTTIAALFIFIDMVTRSILNYQQDEKNTMMTPTS